MKSSRILIPYPQDDNFEVFVVNYILRVGFYAA